MLVFLQIFKINDTIKHILIINYKIMSLEQKKENTEQQEKLKEQETKDALLNFWNNSENDKKALEDPKFGQNAVNTIKLDIKEKSKQVNDPKSQEQINDLTKELDNFSKIWKLNEEKAKELSTIYREIISVEGTEHKEDVIQNENFQKSSNEKKEINSKNLLDATEKLKDFLKNNQDNADKKFEDAQKNIKLAREEGDKAQKISSSEADNVILDFPPSQKEIYTV